MRFTPFLCSLAVLSLAVAGPLGERAEAVEWFKSKVPEEVPEVYGETPASRSYFYVGGRYADAVRGQVYI
jgi:hypothetical protein